MKIAYSCEMCGKRVERIRTPANMLKPPRFCSQKCNGASKRGTGHGIIPNTHFTCERCGVAVSVYRGPAQMKKQPPRFCSLACLGLAQKGDGNPAWSGGRHHLNTGYVVVSCSDHPAADVRGCVLEHRLVMERIVGRFLSAEEVVHHVNGIRDDNRPENLVLCANQAAHIALHRSEAA